MNRNLKQPIKALNGTALLMGATVETLMAAINEFAQGLDADQRAKLDEALKKHTGEEMTFASVCSTALLTPTDEDKNLSGDEKVKRFKLAQRLYDADAEAGVDLTVEEAALLKLVTSKLYTALVVGQLYGVLEKDVLKAVTASAS